MDNLYKHFLDTLALESINGKSISEEEMSERFGAFIEKYTILYKPKLVVKGLKISKKHNKFHKKYAKRNLLKWKSPFQWLDLLLLMCRDIVEEINNRFRDSKSDDIVFDVLLRLHAHACQVGAEMICLMKNGYADGAYARWRTLYETFIIALFIMNNGKECAQRFIDHSIVDYFSLMKKCNIHKDKINQTPPSPSDYDQCEALYNKICRKYSDKFGEPYGWSTPYIMGRPSFSAIETSVEQNHIRFYYSKVSTATHCSYYGLINKLGQNETNKNILLIGLGLKIVL